MIGLVYKYENRAVAIHAVKDEQPVCGTRVDYTSFETYDGYADDVTCRRCAVIIKSNTQTERKHSSE
jgi:hypothetical protein